MTENDYIAEYVKEKHPGILNIDYAVWRLARALSVIDIFMRKSISQLSEKDLTKMMDDDEELKKDNERQ